MAPEFDKPIHQLPLIPADVLKKHRVHEPLDTRFRSAARLAAPIARERSPALAASRRRSSKCGIGCAVSARACGPENDAVERTDGMLRQGFFG